MPNPCASMGCLPLLLSLWVTLVATSRIQVQNQIISKTLDNQTLKYGDFVESMSKFQFDPEESDLRQNYYQKLISMNNIWNSLGTKSYRRGLTGFSLLTGIQFGNFLQAINGPGNYFGLPAQGNSGFATIRVDCNKCIKRSIRKIAKYIYENYFSNYHNKCTDYHGSTTIQNIDFVYTAPVFNSQSTPETKAIQESGGIVQKSKQTGSKGEKGNVGAKVILSPGIVNVSVTDFDCQLSYQNQNSVCVENAGEQPNVEERLVMLLEGMKRGSSEPSYYAYPTTCEGPLYTQMGITDYQPISGCGSFEAALNGSLFSDGEGRQVIVLVNAGNWQHYKQGVLEQDMTDTANHYVLLTGMNKAENTWTVENSWGETWGENGNARIAMGSSQQWEVNPFCYKGYVFY